MKNIQLDQECNSKCKILKAIENIKGYKDGVIFGMQLCKKIREERIKILRDNEYIDDKEYINIRN